MYKIISKSSLTWYELEEIVMEVEITLNNKPLSYIEDDIQMPILTPNTMIYGTAISEVEEDVRRKGFEKKSKAYSEKQKSNKVKMNNRGLESLKELHEHHNLQSTAKRNHLTKGDVMLIHGISKIVGNCHKTE